MPSYFDSILAERNQGPELRQPLLNKIGKAFDGRVVVAFYTTFDKPQGAIDGTDAGMIETLLQNLPNVKKKGLLLIIDSPGGDPLAAERIVKICRDYYDGNFVVLVPGRAKSAATLISLGASTLALSPSSELGPIDIQVNWGGKLTPAYAIIKAYDDLLERGLALGLDKRIEPILQQLSAFNPASVEELRNLNELSESIAVKVLKSGMMSALEEDEIKKRIKIFTDTEHKAKTHGRPIFCDDIKKVDPDGKFVLRVMPVEDPIWKIISEYHARVSYGLAENGRAKVIESASGAYSR